MSSTTIQALLGQSSADRGQYAVDSIDVTGYARVEPDMSARIGVCSYFQGQPLPTDTDSSVDGPYDGTLREVWTTEQRDLVWSPCGVVRDLVVRTRLGLRNAETATQPSWIDLNAYEADSDSGISVRLVRKHC